MKTHIKNSKNPEPVNTTHKGMHQKPIANVLQAYKNQTIQRMENEEELPIQRKTANCTGLPDKLKCGIEQLSGYSMDDVRVHYHSDKPAQFRALAYTKGTDIHVASGQERHLPHEAWHVVQQMQGRVQPTTQLKGIHINDSSSLEQEADVMGQRALKGNSIEIKSSATLPTNRVPNVIQMVRTYVIEDRSFFGNIQETHLTNDARLANYRQQLKEASDETINNLFGLYVPLSERGIHLPRKERINKIMGYTYLMNRTNRDLNIFPMINDLEMNIPESELTINETLILVSHGSNPLPIFGPIFGKYNPKGLATRLLKKGIIPTGYSGLIYINGCNTANGKKDYNDGTSFISLFKNEMVNIFTENQLGTFHVKGNLGEASTISSVEEDNRGKDSIIFTQNTINQLRTRIYEVIYGNQSLAAKVKWAERAVNLEERIRTNDYSFIGKPGTYTI